MVELKWPEAPEWRHCIEADEKPPFQFWEYAMGDFFCAMVQPVPIHGLGKPKFYQAYVSGEMGERMDPTPHATLRSAQSAARLLLAQHFANAIQILASCDGHEREPVPPRKVPKGRKGNRKKRR